MKKTVTVNISGIIFHIDEDAYFKLSEYIEDIRSYLTSAEGKDEIIADVEARIAEMLQQKVKETKQVVTIEDVDEVIQLMGEPSQFGTDDNDSRKQKESGRFAKRFYRDPDNKVIGGVCSGIANYFNFDALWVRIIFAVALVFFGSGVLFYILLWIITPEARTTAEKLEMRGEKVNIHNIEKSVKEELSLIKRRFKKAKKKSSLSTAKFDDNANDSFFERLLLIFFNIIRVIVRAIVIILGILLIFIGFFLLIGFIGSFLRGTAFISYTSEGFNTFSLHSFLYLIIDSPAQITLVSLGLFLLIGIPLIMIIYNGLKMIFGFKSNFKVIGISAFSLWISGLILCLFVFVNIFKDFSSNAVITKKYSIAKTQNKQFYIDIKSNDSLDDFLDMDNNNSYYGSMCYILKQLNNKTGAGLPQVAIKTGERTDSIRISILAESKGYNHSEAMLYARDIRYDIHCSDTSLLMEPFFLVENYKKWRMQRIKVLIKIPEGEKVVIGRKLLNYLKGTNHIKNNDDLFDKKGIINNGMYIKEEVK